MQIKTSILDRYVSCPILELAYLGFESKPRLTEGYHNSFNDLYNVYVLALYGNAAPSINHIRYTLVNMGTSNTRTTD